MAISKTNRDFIDSLIDYYISEVESYRLIAEEFIPEIESVPDTAFGIIAGCVYSGFLQAYQTQQQSPGLDDIREFNQIIKSKSAMIKRSIIDSMGSGAGTGKGDGDEGSGAKNQEVRAGKQDDGLPDRHNSAPNDTPPARGNTI